MRSPPTFHLASRQVLIARVLSLIIDGKVRPSPRDILQDPWIKEKESRVRWSWWLTFLMCWIGVGCSGIVIYFGWTGVHQILDSDLCLVLDDEFNSGSLDTSVWTRDIELGGFG